MRIRFRPAVAGEMLAGRRHAGLLQPLDIGLTQATHLLRITAQGAVADHLAAPVIQVQYRREADIDTAGEHLGRHQPGRSRGQLFLLRSSAPGNPAERWQPQHIPSQALHPPAFLVDSDQHVGAQRTNAADQLAHLGRGFGIAGKQDHAADFGLSQQLTVFRRQPGAGQVQHQSALFQ